MQGTAQGHREIADALLPQADPVFDDATALDTAGHMLDPSPARVQELIGPLLLPCQLLAARFLGRHEHPDSGEREGQEAQILEQWAPRGPRIGCGLGNLFIMDAASVCLAQKEDREWGIDEQDGFHRQVKYLNNMVEQDHRTVKRVTRPMLGFKSFNAAQDTLVGLELMHMIKKRQMVVEVVRSPDPPPRRRHAPTLRAGFCAPAPAGRGPPRRPRPPRRHGRRLSGGGRAPRRGARAPWRRRGRRELSPRFLLPHQRSCPPGAGW